MIWLAKFQEKYVEGIFLAELKNLKDNKDQNKDSQKKEQQFMYLAES
jgi:hypothetical protein